MSIAYRGVFSESMLSLENALQKLSNVFRERGLSFTGSVARIGAEFSLDLSFYVEEGHDLEEGLQVDSIDQIIPIVSEWQGISILCHWTDLLNATGNGIVSEIDFYLLRVEKGCRIAFEEERAANNCRREDPSLAQNFYQMLIDVCERLGISNCVYGNETSMESLYPDTSTVEEILNTGMLPEGGEADCVVFRAESFSWEDIQKHALAYDRELALSSSGYGILKFPPPED